MEAKIPEEIRVAVFRYVTRQDAANLAVVCRAFLSAAEQVLYEDIQPTEYLDFLYRTLLDRPDLGEIAKNVHLSLCSQGLVVPAVVCHRNPSATSEDDHRVSVEIAECRLAGLILRALPELQSLNLDVLSLSDRSPRANATHNLAFWHEQYVNVDPIVAIFGPEYDPSDPSHIARLSQIPGLKRLRILKYKGTKFPASLSCLQNLEIVQLGHNCEYRAQEEYTG